MLVELGDLRNNRHDEGSILLLLRGRVASTLELLQVVTLLQFTQIFKLLNLIEVQVQVGELLAATDLPDLPDLVVR